MKHVHSLSLSATWRLQNNEFYLYLQEPCDLEAVILLCLLGSFLDKWHFPWFTGNSLSCSEKWHFFIRPQISSDEVLILFLSSPLIRPYFWGGGLGHPGLKITHTSQSLQALLGLRDLSFRSMYLLHGKFTAPVEHPVIFRASKVHHPKDWL